MDEIITSGKSNKRLLPLMIALVVVSAGLSGGITYALSRSGKTTLSPLVQISQDLADHQYNTALQVFNSQPADVRNSQFQQTILSTIYFDMKSYNQALSLVQQIAKKWGWNYNLSIEASKIASSEKNYAMTLVYYELTDKIFQSDITTLQKVVSTH